MNNNNFLTSKSHIDKTTPDFTYLNLHITNSSQNEHFYSDNPQIQYSESLLNPIVEEPHKYYMYISRFSLESCLLPVWCPEIVDNQPNPNLTAYSITMTFTTGGNTYSYTQNMIYSSEQNASPPTSSSMLVDKQLYYYVFSYSHAVYLFNNMLQNCFNGLQTAYGENFSVGCPFIAYDSASGLFSLYSEEGDEVINIFFNANLYNLFYSFYFRNNNQLVIDNNNGLNTVVINGKNYTKTTQDYPSTSIWSPISSLVFTTTKLPIVSELSSVPLQYNDASNLGSNNTTQPLYQKIITDISLPLDRSSDYRAFISYSPAFPRKINMTPVSGLKDINIFLYFKSKSDGNLIPMLLPNGCSVNIKICFEKIK